MTHGVLAGWDFLWWPMTGRWYAFTSSFGSDLTELAVVGVVYKHFRCHSCWRIARRQVAGTTYRTCWRHTTAAHHARLVEKHARKRPATHAFLNDQENR